MLVYSRNSKCYKNITDYMKDVTISHYVCKENLMKKRIVCLVLGFVMLFSQSLTTLATTKSEITQEKARAESELDAANERISALSEKQAAIQSQIDDTNAELVDLLINIEATENDIADAEKSIAATQTLIEKTTEDLRIAEENKNKQYSDMKKRIVAIYENGGDAAWFKIILESKDLKTLLNRAEYAQSMHNYDREMLDKFVAVVNQVTELKNTLEAQKAELETEKAGLEAQRADLVASQARLQTCLDQMKATNANYENQIAEVQAQAAQISDLIEQQEAELERIEEEERREAEEAARREEEARQEEERRAQASSSSNSTTSNTTSSSNTSSNSSTSSSSSSNTSNNTSSKTESDNTSSSSSSSSSESYKSGGKSGYEIVAYADQFVGNPYVWGGNSLTNGIDCSHFVYQVLKNCGVYDGGYVTSSGWRTKGRAVASLAEAQAGDVLCYSGHVAIYDGNGGIVEAKGAKWGITHDRRADYKTILAIRRFT